MLQCRACYPGLHYHRNMHPRDPARLRPFLATTLDATDLPFLGQRYQGKVRDVYRQGDESILIATDRQSAFDIHWCSIPLKGQTLNQISAWWFQRISDIMPTHVLAVPDPNVMVVKQLRMIPVEIVVRDYLTGSTGTSVWSHYAKGGRHFCGNPLPDGLQKNMRLPNGPIITPTTKGDHDEPIDAATVVARSLATAEEWKHIADRAFALFRRGQDIAAERGLILVDTKYEMGYDHQGQLTIADEVHTPDSSRYWIKASYDARMAAGEEPESLDKEFFRLWLREQGFEYGGHRPAISDDVRLQLGERYINLYERMTGEAFELPTDPDVPARIRTNMMEYAQH